MKKGFTLIELLAVIAILGIIVMITVPIINGAINTSKSKAYDRQKESIIEAARSYMSKNPANLPVSGTKSVSVATLRTEGFLQNKDIKNPLYVAGSTNEQTKNQKFNGVVCVSYSSNKYNYTYKESNAC